MLKDAEFWRFGYQGVPNASVIWVLYQNRSTDHEKHPQPLKSGCWGSYHNKLAKGHFLGHSVVNLCTFLHYLLFNKAFICDFLPEHTNQSYAGYWWVGGCWLANYLISAPDLWAAHHSHWLSSFEASVSVSVASVGRPGTIGGRASYYLLQGGSTLRSGLKWRWF